MNRSSIISAAWPHTCRGVSDNESDRPKMPRFMTTSTSRRAGGDINLGEEEGDYDHYERPRNFVGPYDEEAAYRAGERRGEELVELREAAQAAFQFPNLPTGDSMKAVTSATTVTSAEAMSSASELCLYLMNTCDPHCPKSCTSCKPRWSILPSPEAEKAHVAKMENEHGIVKRIDPRDDNKTVRVDIQNKHMKGILTSVFDGYPDFHASLLPENSAWVFNEPFDMFVGRWDQLREYSFQTPFAAEKAAWVALVAAMTPVVQPTLDSIKRIRDTGLVLWKDLHLIFPPGKLIIVEEPGAVQSVVRVQEGKATFDPRTHQKAHKLQFEFVDWDGETHGLRTKTLDIPLYAGHKKVRVSDLRTMPLDFCPSEEELRTKLVARGRRWTSMKDVDYKQFAGKKVPINTLVPIEASGRIMIDTAAFYDNNPGPGSWQKPTLQALAAETDVDDMGDSAQSAQLSDEQCLLASGVVCGFDLKIKDWCLFPVDGISDITFNNLAYDKLVLPPGEKNMAWAFVESKNRLLDASDSDGSTAFDDFVADKGKGLVMLLCGSPGVGKTYTAEAIAEMAKVPLYMISAGELGSVPSQVEEALDEALGLCRRWKAMLLLDEADVFLGKRFSGGNTSIERNELVSIFLRRLEYYQGTMFLTTNKIENIDDAFQSRIDIILPYGDLTSEARHQVWINFINKSGGTEIFDLTEQQVQQLAREYNLNGREIKNLVKSSLLVAGKFGGPGIPNTSSTGGSETNDNTAAAKDPAPAKVTMGILETLAAMRIRAHKLMGKTEDDGGIGI